MVKIMGLPSPTKDTCHATFRFAQNMEPEETAVLMRPFEFDTAEWKAWGVNIMKWPS